MIKVNPGTKKADEMLWTWKNCYKGDDVRTAYGKCSADKKDSFDAIRRRAIETEGYNHDLKVTGANCYSYSTMYSFTNEEGTYIVKDTVGGTYILKID